jgi:DNA-binding transcriptional regulator WhiA
MKKAHEEKFKRELRGINVFWRVMSKYLSQLDFWRPAFVSAGSLADFQETPESY